MPARKPSSLHTRHSTKAEQDARSQAEESMQPESALPRNPARLKKHPIAAAAWRRMLKIYDELDAEIVSRLDQDLLIDYCMLIEQLTEMAELRKNSMQLWRDLDKERLRVAILEEGMKWHQMGLPPGDAQFLETRKFQTAEIARLFRVPPHMIGDVDRSTSWGTGIEQQNIGFVVYSLRTWLVRFEQEYNWKLLTETERKIYFMEFLVDGLLRGDLKSRYDAYAVARQNGWMNGNEIRELENMNPVDGLDTYLANGSLTPADGREASAQPTAQPSEPPANEGDEGDACQKFFPENSGVFI